MIHSKLVRNVMITLDARISNLVILSRPEVIELANKLRMAVGNHDTATDTPIGTGDLDPPG